MTLFQMMEYMTNNGISYCFNSYARNDGEYFFYNMKIDDGIKEHYIHEETHQDVEARMKLLWKTITGKKPKEVKKSVPMPAPLPAPKGIPLPPGM